MAKIDDVEHRLRRVWFVIQEHHASSHHFGFRVEEDDAFGTLPGPNARRRSQEEIGCTKALTFSEVTTSKQRVRLDKYRDALLAIKQGGQPLSKAKPGACASAKNPTLSQFAIHFSQFTIRIASGAMRFSKARREKEK